MDFRRILLIRTDRIGDVVLTLPVVDLIRTAWPQARVTFMVREYTRELVERAPGVDGVILVDQNGRPRPDKEILSELTAGQFDVAVHVFPRPRWAWLTWKAGIPVRVGTAFRWYSFLFNRFARDHRKTGLRHEAVFNARLLLPLGIDVPDHVRPRLIPSEQHKLEADRVWHELGLRPDDRPVILHPGSGGSSRDWPAHRFAELARILVERRPVVVTGTLQEAALVEQVIDRSGGLARACVGRMSLMPLAAFIRRASVFVANSTGPLHIAAAVGTPVIGFYPPIAAASVSRWGPLGDRAVTFIPDVVQCPRCQGDVCAGGFCMEQIEVRDVVAAIDRMLAGPAA